MSPEDMKAAAGKAAMAHVRDGMRLGIGSGSTAEAFVAHLAEAVGNGLDIIGVPTSERTARLCVEMGIRLESLDDIVELDLVIDGADEIDPHLNLIKGGGGALLREKIVAHAAKRMIVIADESKLVDKLGRYPLPIEVNGFGIEATRRSVETVARAHGATGEIALRTARKGESLVTDGGHLIIDASFGHISDPQALACALNAIPGVVENGLFLSMAGLAIIAGDAGVRELTVP
ncbi:MAG: ribose-5-phosphate isomerase RpiA [Roseitalea sp.]|jgi:ribose 5-phosphate isomerase A|nr:ribose-5-phosphate isomerase RpiA [Roseitalea sp.]MBO6721792.1 ribose-5-phosphate isomerase RpiA [Roseitalea sp.]MBO6741600.1 ribose-5-phosphate isomerase RpiA [Roseitalea sp.]